ncbi:hypothetical protein ACFO5O_10410 [Geojedonia litorea]|uniref:Histidine kinase-, DNA gyrase B-, and HSP90-like ATPase n=1 Tax=Geojedonia litorea TaxID=1268269 RepID=A0ABV9N3X3_9FLAO
MEENCKWHFKPEGGSEIGPNDPLHITFKGNPYYSIVREAIQNSLDAIADNNNPVVVSFQYFDLNRLEFPAFFEIENHINQCLEYYNENADAKRLFGDMLKYLNGTEEGKKRLKISCLKISDANTKGMHFDEGTNSPFYAFLRASGVSSKNLGAGGSFGFGKGAYFALSPIKTLIVSSKDTEGNVFFEGATRLTTHKNENGVKTSAFGFYDNNSGCPTTIENEIPEVLKREESGTDVNIIGLWEEKDRKKLMIKSVLNNFWLAIHDNKLIVQIDDVEISKSNLEQTIDEYFEGQAESGTPTEIESWNPKSYLKAVKYAENNEQFKVFKETLPTIGKVKMYVYMDKGLPNRTSYFRTPRMVVFKRTNRKVKGYSAVFICDNEKGNEMLRLMENPAHNEWNLDNYPKNEGQIDTDARRGYGEISKFINDSLESLSKVKTGKKLAFQGLEEYLSIPEDLLEKEEEFDYEGDLTNMFSGNMSNKVTDEETPLQTTEFENVKIKPTITPKQEVKESDFVGQDENNDEFATTGGDNESSGGDMPGQGDSDATEVQPQEESTTKSKVLIKVGLRIAAQRQNGHLFHNLIIYADDNIPNAELELLVGADNDRDDSLEIIETDNGNIAHNALKNVNLNYGKNLIKVRFADNLKHTVKIKAYELQ